MPSVPSIVFHEFDWRVSLKPIQMMLIALALMSQMGAAVSATQKQIKDCGQDGDADLKLLACNKLLEDASFVNAKKSHVWVLQQRVFAFVRKEKISLALSDADEAVRLDPKNPDVWAGRGTARAAAGQLAASIDDYNKALALGASKLAILNNRALVEIDLKDFDRALDDLTEAVRINPRIDTLYAVRADVWRLSAQNYDKAIADLSKAIELNPGKYVWYSYRAQAWQLKGDLTQALRDVNKAIENDVRQGNSYRIRGDINRYRGSYDRALSDYDHALTLRPTSISSYVGRGLTYEKMGDLPHARAEFEKALSSTNEFKLSDSARSLETAKARLAAFDSGATQPTIAPVPIKVTSVTSIPTPAVSEPAAIDPNIHMIGRRVALVIGNSAYSNVPALGNPKNDAQAIAASLGSIGFQTVTLVIDATREKLIEALRSFANEAETSDWAMVYYAGHGIEVGGINYLIPIDAKLAVDRDIEYEAVSVPQVLRAANSAKKIKLVMLDACRDNPFKPRKTDAPAAIAASKSTAGRAIATRSTNGRGLAEIKVSGATLVVFAAKDGQVALDGEGGNSPFAVAVVQRIATPGVEINKVFRLVRDDVMEATAGRQEPYTYGSLPGKEDFFFVAK